MSTIIDEQVVEMRFDNRDFERNTRQSMSTLEKLKRSLRFKDSAKELDNVNSSIKKISFNGLSKGVNTVKLKFSALEIAGITCLQRITNSAITTGKRLVDAFTIDPIKSGLQEYETQINAVQTILANTKSKGTTLEDVNEALDELNKYADLTIYNFTEMTRNIGTFTAAGIGLKESTVAIQGIANMAAVSGSTSEQASRAMYQLSQALAAGTVKLQDWNSVVNAGMGGEVFQNALKDTARKQGIAVDEMIKTAGSFRESLQKGWITSEVLTETLAKMTKSGAAEYLSKLTGISQDQIEAQQTLVEKNESGKESYDKLAESMAKTGKVTKEEALNILEMADTATDAATKVKTFTQLMDTLKEAMQSGWTQTWELIIGDFEEAKALFTSASNFFGDLIAKASDARNNLLKGALDSVVTSTQWDSLKQAGVDVGLLKKEVIKTAYSNGVAIAQLKADYGSFENSLQSCWLTNDIMKKSLKNLGITAVETSKKVKKSTTNLKDLKAIALDVIKGNWDNGNERKRRLTEAGKDYEAVQKVVNHILLGTKLDLDNVSKAELKTIGLTDDQSKRFLKMAKAAKKAGTPLNEFVKNLERPSGRELLIDSLANIGNALVKTFKAIGKAYRNIFPPTTSEQIYELIKKFHEFTEMLNKSASNKENIDNLTRAFQGLFAVIDVIKTVIGGGFKIAFEIVKEVFKALDVNILDTVGSLGDALVKFRDWIKTDNVLTQGIKALAHWIAVVVSGVIKFIKSLKDIPAVQSALEKVGKFFSGGMSSISDFLKNATNMADKFISKIKEMNGFSPEKFIKFFKILKDVVVDFVKGRIGNVHQLNEVVEEVPNGLKISFDSVLAYLKGFKDKFISAFKAIIDWVGDINWDAVFVGAGGFGLILILNKIGDTVDRVREFVKAPIDIIDKLANRLGKAKALEMKSQALLNFAKSVGILVAALYLLGKMDTKDLSESISIMAGLSIGMVALLAVLNRTSKGIAGINVAATAASIISFALAVRIMIKTLNELNDVDDKTLSRNLIALGVVVMMMKGVVKKLSFNATGGIKGGMSMIAFAVAVRMMINNLKKIDDMELEHGIRTMVILAILIKTMQKVCSSASGIQTAGAGFTIIAMALSINLLLKTFKTMEDLDTGSVVKGLAAIVIIMAMMNKIINATKDTSTDATTAGAMMLMMSVSMLIIVKAIDKITKIDQNGLTKASVVIGGMMLIMKGIVKVSAYAGEHAAKAGAMLLSMSVTLLVMTLVMSILSKMSGTELATASTAITVMCGCIAGLIAVTKLAEKVQMGPLIVLTAAIMILSGVMIALSELDNPDGIKNASVALSAVLGAFAALVASTSMMRGINAKSLITLTMLTLVVTALGGIVLGLAALDAQSAIGASMSISTLLLAMAGACSILSLTDGPSKNALIGMGIMTAVVTGLGVILGVMSYFNVEGSIQTAVSMGILLNAMAAALLILDKVNGVSAKVLLAMGAMELALAGLGLIFAELKALGVSASIEDALALGILLNAMATACLILTPVGAFAEAALAGVVVLDVLIGTLAVVMIGLAKLNKWCSKDGENVIAEGIPILIAIGEGLGRFVGSIVGSLVDSIMSYLPNLGTYLSEFVSNASGFIDSINEIKPKSANAAKTLAEAILILTAGELLDGLASFLGAKMDMGKLKETMTGLGEGVCAFNDAISNSDFSGDALEKASNAAAMLASLNNSLPRTGGKLQEWIGEKDLSSFGEKLKTFGTCLVEFSKAISAEGAIDPKMIETATTLGKGLAELNNNLPASDGYLQAFLGNKDLGEWGRKLVSFGRSLVLFSSSLTQNGGVKPKAIKTAKRAGEMMAALNDKIPANDGIINDWFMGDKDLATFGEKLVSFGKSLVKFSNKVADLDKGSIKRAKSAGSMMATLASELPETKGIFGFFSGDKMDLEDFGEDLEAFGSGIAAFSETIRGKIRMSDVAAAQIAGTMMASLYEKLGDDDGIFDIFGGGKMDLEDFGDDLEDFGESLADFSETIADVSVDNMEGIPAVVSSLVDASNAIDAHNFEVLAEGFDELANSNINSFLGLFVTAKEKIKVAVKTFFNDFTTSVTARKQSLTLAGGLMGNTCLEGINQVIRDGGYYNAGVNASQGFVNGVLARVDDGGINSAGFAIGITALEAAMKALDEHSPSKKMYKVGDFAVEGFINALQDGKADVKKISTQLMTGFVKNVGSFASMNKYASEAMQLYVTNYTQSAKKLKAVNQELQNDLKNIYKWGLDKYAKQIKNGTIQSVFGNIDMDKRSIIKWSSEMKKTYANELKSWDYKPTNGSFDTVFGTSWWGSDKGINLDAEIAFSPIMVDKDGKNPKFLSADTVQQYLKKVVAQAKANLKGTKYSQNALYAEILKVDAKTQGTKVGKEYIRGLIAGISDKKGRSTDKINAVDIGALMHFSGKYGSIQLLNKQISLLKVVEKNAYASSSAMSAFIKKLYKESSAYATDKANLKNHTKALKKLYKERAKLQKQYNKATEESEKKSLAKQIKQNAKEISKAKDQLIKDGNEIEKNAKKVYKALKKSIKESVKSYMDFFSLDISKSDNSIFDAIVEKSEEASSSLTEFRDNLASTLQSYVDISSIDKDTGISLFEEFSSGGQKKEKEDAITSAQETLTNATTALAEANAELANAQKKLATAQERSNAVAGRSIVFLDAITDAEKEVAEAQSAVTSATTAQTEAQKALNTAQQDSVMGDILDNMESQIKGIQELEANYEKLAQEGLSEGLLAKLKELGTSGADQVEAFVNASAEQIEKANKLFAESETMSTDKFLDNFRSKINDLVSWKEKLTQIQSLDLSDSVKMDILEKASEEGASSAEYLKTILDMSKDELKEFNKLYEKSLTIPQTIAKKISKATSETSKETQEETEETIASIIQTMNENNKELSSYQADLKKLRATGLCDGMIEELEKLGIEGHSKIKLFLDATKSEISEANKAFEKNGELTSKTMQESIVDQFADKIIDAKKWKGAVDELKKRLDEFGFSVSMKNSIMKDVEEKGIDGLEYINALLGMNSETFVKFKEEYKEYMSIPADVANQVIAAEVAANQQNVLDAASGIAKNVFSEMYKLAEKGGSTVGDRTTTGVQTSLRNNTNETMSAAKKVAKGIIIMMKEYLCASEGKSLGKNVVQGVLNGLNSGNSSIISAAKNMAKGALVAAKTILGIHSPSKEFEKVGKFSDIGFANGISNYSTLVKDASADVGDEAVATLSNSIKRISGMVDSDMDAAPTIRPVIDLTDVNKGSDVIDDLLSDKSIGVTSLDMASKISKSMNEKNNGQNGQNANNSSYDYSQQNKFENTFHITGDNPKEIANEVSIILQRQLERRGAVWA